MPWRSTQTAFRSGVKATLARRREVRRFPSILDSRTKAFTGKAFHAAIKSNAMTNTIIIKFY